MTEEVTMGTSDIIIGVLAGVGVVVLLILFVYVVRKILMSPD